MTAKYRQKVFDKRSGRGGAKPWQIVLMVIATYFGQVVLAALFYQNMEDMRFVDAFYMVCRRLHSRPHPLSALRVRGPGLVRSPRHLASVRRACRTPPNLHAAPTARRRFAGRGTVVVDVGLCVQVNATTMTVGYGDFSPSTKGGRVFAIFNILIAYSYLARCGRGSEEHFGTRITSKPPETAH